MADSSPPKSRAPAPRRRPRRSRAAQEEPGHGSGQDDQREGHGEEVERHEGQHREAHENLWLMVRLPILKTASTTMAITTGCMP